MPHSKDEILDNKYHAHCFFGVEGAFGLVLLAFLFAFVFWTFDSLLGISPGSIDGIGVSAGLTVVSVTPPKERRWILLTGMAAGRDDQIGEAGYIRPRM